ncbi:MAG: squalene--hopene cyclase, partial [Polyangiaceae bacterium]|nr:squalene--hopene cyclase [Polyangiaceae bacterium]
LYQGRYEDQDWVGARNRVADSDNLAPQTLISRSAQRLLNLAEAASSPALRKKALDFVLHQIDREDRNTNYICIGPINKMLNTLVWYLHDPEGPELQAHRARMRDYLYQADDGIKMQGYNSSRLWDTAFAVQGVFQARAALQSLGDKPGEIRELTLPLLRQAHGFIDQNQVREDVCDAESAFRHPSKGGWPFSDRPHGWPISDCTAEGIKASLLNEEVVEEPIDVERLLEGVELLLSLQNKDGGWATYELTRGSRLLELLNPSDCFRDIMVDYSYVECTSASIQALQAFGQRYPHLVPEKMFWAIHRGMSFLRKAQLSSGAFEGSWGVCFTYGTWFGICGLKAGGARDSEPALLKARAFLEDTQRADGGWGESVGNCETRSYNQQTESQAVMTAWAVLGLLECGGASLSSVRRGIQFLVDRQLPGGDFPDENIAGVFNKTCAIHYDNYLKVFPLWALSRFSALQDISAAAE